MFYNGFGLGEGGLCGNKSLPAFAKPVLYEGGISRTTPDQKHVKRKRKNERGKQFNLNKMNKKEKMEVSLSKLTIEEQELLGLIKKPKPPRVKKNHKLKIFYMIGDADGHTDEEAVISINNPFLKPLTETLDKLGKIEGHWGIMFDEEHYDGNRKIGNINDFEYELLSLVTGYDYDEDTANDFLKKYGYDESEQNHDYLQEFEGLLISDTEYSFLVYENYKLK